MPIVSTVSLSVTLSNGVSLANTYTRPPNENAPGVIDWKLFPVGFTLIPNPPGDVRGLFIIPQAGGTNPIALVKDSNDDGINLNPAEVTYLALAGNTVIGLKVSSGPTLIRLIWV